MKRFFTPFIVLFIFTLQSFSQSKNIRINQIGFLPFSEKLAVCVKTTSTSFSIVDENDSVVFINSLSNESTWAAAGEAAKIADFSIVSKPGLYRIYVEDLGYSYEFEISDSVFNHVNNAVVKAFYLNRASIELLPEFAGKYVRPFAHADTHIVVLPSAAGPVRKAGDVISAPKGWYDAGDYNKYIVNSGITTGTLLLAYENYSAYYDTLTWNLPESSNDIADLLDEIKWNLDWMLTMQDPADGGVYNKTTEASFSSMVMPDKVKATRYVVAKGTAAALDFAAVMAMAGRVYKNIDPIFADSCLQAAEMAWEWAQKNPNVSFNNPAASGDYPAVSTGGYGDGTFTDEKIWAASELLISTKNAEKYASSVNLSGTFNTPQWSNVGFLALYSLYTHKDSIGDVIDTAKVKELILTKANQLISNRNGNAFKISVTNFGWGSNGVVANESIILLYAFSMTANMDYFNAALSCYDYLLGRNALNISFVTGYGDVFTKNIHHRVSEADANPNSVPGFLSGGPNATAGGDCTGEYSVYDAKSYKDETCSFTTNEIAINWQAPMVYMSHALKAEYTTWVANLPKEYVFTNIKSINLERTDETAGFSVSSNSEWNIVANDDWYSLSVDTVLGSSVVYVTVLGFNEGDSIRNSSMSIFIGDSLVTEIQISQKGNLTNFRVEAEDYELMQGVATEATGDVGGGVNVGWIDAGDSMTYNLDITHEGTYVIEYRVASLNKTGEFNMFLGDSVISNLAVAPTGGWQAWKTIVDTVFFEIGIQTVTITVPKGGFNFNYFDFKFITSENIAPEHKQPEVITTNVSTVKSFIGVKSVRNSTIYFEILNSSDIYSLDIYSANGIKICSDVVSLSKPYCSCLNIYGYYSVVITDMYGIQKVEKVLLK